MDTAAAFRGALQLSDRLTQENTRLLSVITDLIYAYQNDEGGWDRMDEPIAKAKDAIGMVPAPVFSDEDRN